MDTCSLARFYSEQSLIVLDSFVYLAPFFTRLAWNNNKLELFFEVGLTYASSTFNVDPQKVSNGIIQAYHWNELRL